MPALLLWSFFQRMICVSNWVLWSVRRERYTIAKSGPKHRERQNSQSWAHKLHWGGIILYFAWSAPLLLPSCHLSYPKLTSEFVGWGEKKQQLFIFDSFSMWILLWVPLLHIWSVFPVRAASQYFGSQSARPANRRVSGCSLLPHHFTIMEFTFILHYASTDTYRRRYGPWGRAVRAGGPCSSEGPGKFITVFKVTHWCCSGVAAGARGASSARRRCGPDVVLRLFKKLWVTAKVMLPRGPWGGGRVGRGAGLVERNSESAAGFEG